MIIFHSWKHSFESFLINLIRKIYFIIFTQMKTMRPNYLSNKKRVINMMEIK